MPRLKLKISKVAYCAYKEPRHDLLEYMTYTLGFAVLRVHYGVIFKNRQVHSNMLYQS